MFFILIMLFILNIWFMLRNIKRGFIQSACFSAFSAGFVAFAILATAFH